MARPKTVNPLVTPAKIRLDGVDANLYVVQI